MIDLVMNEGGGFSLGLLHFHDLYDQRLTTTQ